MATDKRDYKRTKYIDNIKNYREVYEERKEFLKGWSLPQYEMEVVEEGAAATPSDGQGSDVADKTDGAGMNPTVGSGEFSCPCKAKDYRFTSKYGGRQLNGSYEFHKGVDLAPPIPGGMNTTFYAAGDGVVAEMKQYGVGGFGSWLYILHPNGLYTLYGHWQPKSILVKKGDKVKKGQPLAKMGTEGGVAAHLHFEVVKRIGGGSARDPLDPEKYMDIRSGAISIQTKSVEECGCAQHSRASVYEEMGEGAPMHPPELDFEYTLDEDTERIIKLNQQTFHFNKIKREGGLITHSQPREHFLEDRILWARSTKYSKMVQLDKEKFIHLGYDGFDGNMYSEDSAEIFNDLLIKSKLPHFKIISGYRKSEAGRISPHEAGCAIDVQVDDIDEARELADCAWQLGIRAIAFGGSFEDKTAYVHIDVAPTKKRWSYGTLPVYNGPGNWIYNI